MNLILLATALSLAPVPAAPAVDVDNLFQGQQQEIMRDMYARTRSDLKARSEDFFADGGELQKLLNYAALAEASVAAR